MLSNLLCGSRVENKLSSFLPCAVRNLANRPSPRLLISDIIINTFRSMSLASHLKYRWTCSSSCANFDCLRFLHVLNDLVDRVLDEAKSCLGGYLF